ncbi:MAG: hypothetical protein OXF02_01150 [Simkaniaceae bacterium]|nr:hypothetical protein [Simkaniaceae bacterium]
MASAIGDEGGGAVWPTVREQEVATWVDRSLRVPPLQTESPVKKKRKMYAKQTRSEVMDYAVDVRKTRSVAECAKDYDLPTSTVSKWIRDECKTYPELANADPEVYSGRIADYRELLAGLRRDSGTERIRLSDYFSGSSGGWGFNRKLAPATEYIRNGHPYFASASKGARRSFTEGQKRRTVVYWRSGFGGKSVEKCARKCNVCESDLREWIDEARRADEARGCSSVEGGPLPEASPYEESLLGEMPVGDVEGLSPEDGRRTPLWPTTGESGAPRAKKRKVHPKQTRSLVVNYAVDVRRIRSIEECAKDHGLPTSTVSKWIRNECKTYPELANADPEVYSKRIADYRELLADLRRDSGKGRIRLSDYFSDSSGGWGCNKKLEPTAECIRNGHPYFAPAKEGMRRSFAEDQKRRMVVYWRSGSGGKNIGQCARKCNIFRSTLYGWVDEADRRDRARGCSSVEGDHLGPFEGGPFPGISPGGEDPLEDLLSCDIAKLCPDR